MSYTDNDYINLEYYGNFNNMPNITISENDKSQVDNIFINSSFVGKVLVSNDEPQRPPLLAECQLYTGETSFNPEVTQYYLYTNETGLFETISGVTEENFTEKGGDNLFRKDCKVVTDSDMPFGNLLGVYSTNQGNWDMNLVVNNNVIYNYATYMQILSDDDTVLAEAPLKTIEAEGMIGKYIGNIGMPGESETFCGIIGPNGRCGSPNNMSFKCLQYSDQSLEVGTTYPGTKIKLYGNLPEPSNYTYDDMLNYYVIDDMLSSYIDSELTISDFNVEHKYKVSIKNKNNTFENITQIASPEGMLYLYPGDEISAAGAYISDGTLNFNVDTDSEDYEGTYTTIIQDLGEVAEKYKFHFNDDTYESHYEVDIAIMPSLLANNDFDVTSSISFEFYNSDSLICNGNETLTAHSLGSTAVYYSKTMNATKVSGSYENINKIVISQGSKSITIDNPTKEEESGDITYGNKLIYGY